MFIQIFANLQASKPTATIDMKTLIKNATIINEGNRFQASLLIEDERISELILDDKLPEADTVIDATGKYLIPGVIDDQVHFRQPGMEKKADIASESRAAAAGGVTSFMEMPNTNPSTTNMQRLIEKMQIAAETSMVNYAFYMGATEDNIKDIEAIDPSIVAGVKVFMGSSTGNLLVNNPVSLDKIFRASPTLITTHCEDDPTILNNLNKYKAKYGDDIPIKYHPAIRSAEACYKSSALAIELAIKTNANLHVLHLSTAREMDLFSAGEIEEKKITAEVCVHHLWFSDIDYETKGTHIKWNPAIKTSDDREALRNALKNKKIDIVATDHAPHLLSEKNNIYTKAPSGGPLVQHSLQAMLELSKQGIYSIEEVVEKMSHNPALRYKITDRGFIRQEYFADLVLVNPTKSYLVKESNILYKCGWSPFNGNTFSHSIDMTMVNGKIIWQNGEFTDKKNAAMSLKFER